MACSTQQQGEEKKAKERDLPGCVHDERQSFHFPTCNKIHETDLKFVFLQGQEQRKLKRRRRQQQQQQQQHPILNMTMTMTQEDEQQSLEYHLLQKLEYLSSGLWRSVWAVNPGIAQELAVFKFMKQKRDVDHRNMERHRRDALVMERFTSSPNTFLPQSNKLLISARRPQPCHHLSNNTRALHQYLLHHLWKINIRMAKRHVSQEKLCREDWLYHWI